VRSVRGKRDERLRRIEAVTDATLSGLDADDLFKELLERIKALLDVDTAAVLLLDVHAQQLVATAANGLEEEVRRDIRVPVGRGFAGRIASDRKPLAIDDLGPDDVVSPVLREKGIRSLLGVPVFARGEVIGVLHVGTFQPRRFSRADIELLELVADRVSLASLARSNLVEHTAALALQRSLLPSRLPKVPGVELAARYVPGHDAGVGGDWYDVFELPSGRVGVVVGDVSGHGLRSAVVMGRLRSALRAYALICDDPADALRHLDQKISHFEAGSMATVLYAVVEPDRSQAAISLAGHPAPVFVAAQGDAVLLDIPTDFPLGLGGPPPRRRTTLVGLPPGGLLVCYTDGVVERRGELIDVGLERLRASVLPGPAEAVCAAVMAAVGAEHPFDDMALLTIRRPLTAAA
jgi:phosphoserine phosphatase RsbU/P